MKKIIFILTIVMTLTLCFAMNVSALVSNDGYYYKISDGEVIITGHKSATGDLIVPSEIDGIPVTTIGDSAFEAHPNIHNVILPESVTKINKKAFVRCERLASVVAPGVVTIANHAFYGCESLTEVTLGESIKDVGNLAFSSTPVETADLENGVYYIGNLCWDARYVELGDRVMVREGTTCIASGAFGANQMLYVDLPDGLKYIDDAAFSDCSKLISVSVPESVEEIGDGAFRRCSKLVGAYVPETATFTGNPFEFTYNVTLYSTVGSEWQTLAMDYGIGFDTVDDKPAILSVTAIDDLSTVRVNVTTKNDSGATLFAIGYDAEGERVGIKKLVNRKTTFPTGKVETIEVFCWDSFKNLIPHCNSVTLGVIKRSEFKSVTVSQTPESQNHKGNLTDGNLNTSWACNGEGTIVIDLGERKDIKYINVYLKEYNDNRTLPLKVHCSDDNSSWDLAYSGTITKADGYMVSTMVRNDTEYRYIRITVDGNSVSNWCSVAEVEVY